MTFWPLISYYQNSQSIRLSTNFMTLIPSLTFRIMSGFHGAFATSVACQQGTLTLPNTWFRPPFLRLACAPIVETSFPKLAVSFLDFSPWIPLCNFSILLISRFYTLLSPVHLSNIKGLKPRPWGIKGAQVNFLPSGQVLHTFTRCLYSAVIN